VKVVKKAAQMEYLFEFVSSVEELPTGPDVIGGSLAAVGTLADHVYYVFSEGRWDRVDPPLNVRECEAAVGRAARDAQRAKDSLRSFLIQKVLATDAKPAGEDAKALRAVDLIRANTMQLGDLAERFGRGDLAEAVVDAETEFAKALDTLQAAETRAAEARSCG
jgi:hypothetical protein